MNPIPKITNPRQRRALEVLLERKRISVWELRLMVGAANASQLVVDLRKKGFDIRCNRIRMFDQDNRASNPGLYWLPDDMRQIARQAMENAGATGITPDMQTTSKIDCIIKGAS
ncbi:MAG: hypothetical protein HQM00_08570 [Magnetococcales bacterium]|nr:hypothetical protein [Magnetococcales bacterium]